MYSKILVPVDLHSTETSDKALATAKEIAKRDGASLTVVSVQIPIPADTMHAMPNLQPRLDEYLEGHQQDHPVEGLLKHSGSIAAAIQDAAEETSADLVVMGTHDPSLGDYLFGSNAASVALHTPCSVLVVR